MDEYKTFGKKELLTGEMVKSWDLEHCLSATVTVGATASHLDTVYECCTKKSPVDILSSAYAFGGLALALATVALALFAIPLEVTVFNPESSLKDAAKLVVDFGKDAAA